MSYVELEIELDSELNDKLEHLANEEGITVEELIEEIVTNYIDECEASDDDHSLLDDTFVEDDNEEDEEY
jgi:predicted DNA-binding protein